MGRRLAGITVLLVLATGLAACGGGSDAKGLNGEAASANSDQSANGSDAGAGGGALSTSVPGAATGGSGGSKGADGSKAAAPTTTVPEAPKPPLPLEASLEKSCVKAGGEQTITISVPHKSAFAYNSFYPDGKSGIDEGFYGGNKGSLMPAQGTWTDTWVIAPQAPPGTVRVHVQAVHMEYSSAEKDITFELVGPTGVCP